MKCLITDDELVTVKMLKRLLSRYGPCDYALDGREAVMAFEKALFAGQPYDVIFMDILMPHMNGFEALSEIREIESKQEITSEKTAKIILMTGLGISVDTIETYKTSCMEFMYKPIDINGLIHLLKKHKLIADEVKVDST